MTEIDCLECGRAHDEGTSLNGYCEKCVDRFIEKEERKLKRDFEKAGVDLEQI